MVSGVRCHGQGWRSTAQLQPRPSSSYSNSPVTWSARLLNRVSWMLDGRSKCGSYTRMTAVALRQALERDVMQILLSWELQAGTLLCVPVDISCCRRRRLGVDIAGVSGRWLFSGGRNWRIAAVGHVEDGWQFRSRHHPTNQYGKRVEEGRRIRSHHLTSQYGKRSYGRPLQPSQSIPEGPYWWRSAIVCPSTEQATAILGCDEQSADRGCLAQSSLAGVHGRVSTLVRRTV